MLNDKVLFITGSSRGIGAATARLAHAYGATVILHGKTESVELLALAAEMKCQYAAFDVTDEGAARQSIKNVGNIDILINNAGINPSKTFDALETSDWEQILNINLYGVINVSKAVLPIMKEKSQGKIINISSIKGLLHVSGKPAYAASKAAVMRLTSSMAEEFAPYNILINSVAPGFTNTEMTEKTMSPKLRLQIDSIPLKRLAAPEEIAEMVLFLASDRANYITGQTFIVDGGYSISR